MTTQTATVRPLAGPFRWLGTKLAFWMRVIQDTSEMARCAREAERLFELSDDELARRGLTRDGVIQHAFRRYLYL